MNTQNAKRKTQNGEREKRNSKAFTLVEVLAAITVMAIVLPTLMYGISLSANLASMTRHRTEATTLAEQKLNELVATNTWQNGGGGDFGDEGPGYRWQATSTAWSDPNLSEQNLQEVDVSVTWNAQHRDQSVMLSTLVYVPTTGGTSNLPGGL